MNKHSPMRPEPSLLERAAEVYDFGAALRRRAEPGPVVAPKAEPEAKPEPKPLGLRPLPPVRAEAPKPAPPVTAEVPKPVPPVKVEAPKPAPPVKAEAPKPVPAPASAPRPARVPPAAPLHPVDRARLEEQGFIVPDGPVTPLAEEFRIVKRRLLAAAAESERARLILLSSAQPDDGKTFCAINLALSLAGEKDVEVLLVDGDFPKPEILERLGVEPGPGLVEAITDPDGDAERFVVATDIAGLSLLPAGRGANNVPELLASKRTGAVLDALVRGNPRRIVLFDSPPALMASAASILAAKVGQVLLVVRADRTVEADLREAVALLAGCDHVSLLLNGTGLAAGGSRFGAYYGYGQ